MTCQSLHVLGLICVQAALHLATQQGREYGFGPQVDVSCHAATLHMLDPSKLQYLPTNNIDYERDLSIFDKLASRSASCSNHKFTAKGIHDEMTVHKCSPVSVEKVTRNLVKILDNHERQWVEKQNLLSREKLEQNCHTALKAIEYVHVLLQKCKFWSGSFTNIDELEKCVNASDNDDALKVILRNKVAYRKYTSPHDQKARPQLYRLSQITTAELKINLALILTSETDMMQEDLTKHANRRRHGAHVPETAPTEQSVTYVPNKEPEVNINEPCIVIWDTSDK